MARPQARLWPNEAVFSRRAGWTLTPNRLHQLAQQARRRGALIDLTLSNPTRCGFAYPAGLLEALAAPQGLAYDPQPLGLEPARAAVRAYYRERGAAVPERLLLAAGTSEAYAHLFRLLCDPGDAVLMPTPGYPLFDMLAGIEAVDLQPVPMSYERGWRLDPAALAAAAGPRVRALLLVNPNNPAGCYLAPGAWTQLQALAAERGWALVVDEVFFDYALPPFAPQELELEQAAALTFVLNGLSKIAALPQMKLAWIGVFGPEAAAEEALARLEVINDLFLSAATPVQLAAAAMLEARHEMQRQIRARLQVNVAALDAALQRVPAVERLEIEGGWSALLRLPRVHSDEAWAETILEQAGVLTHPGHFFGMTQESHLALSLLPREAEFALGVHGLLGVVAKELEA
jgi:alanine-synthesizing transaminase